MKKVEVLSDYKELLAKNKASHLHIDTNCFLMSNAMNEHIEADKLFVEEYKDGLMFFIDEGSFFNLYYFWETGKPFPNLKQEKPVLIEELNNKGSRDAYLSQIEPVFLQAGFSLFFYKKTIDKSVYL